MYTDSTHPRKRTNTEPGTFAKVVRETSVKAPVSLYRQARAVNRDAVFFHEQVVQFLGENYLEMGHLRSASLLFEVNVEAWPDSQEAHLDLGRAHLAGGEIGPAIENFRKAHGSTPRMSGARILLKDCQSSRFAAR